MKELKKCTFCGGKAHVRYIAVMENPYYPECMDEHCIAGDIGIGFKSEEEAIKTWNRRCCD